MIYMTLVRQAAGDGLSALSSILGADLRAGGIDKDALLAQLAVPRNELLAEAATLSPAMATLFADQARAEVAASVRPHALVSTLVSSLVSSLVLGLSRLVAV